MRPHKSPGPTLNLEWASQQLQPNGPARSSRITVQPLQSPHLSHKLALPSPANILSPTEYLKYQKLHLIGQCGRKYICRRVIDSLCKERYLLTVFHFVARLLLSHVEMYEDPKLWVAMEEPHRKARGAALSIFHGC
ncbi:hypothetical protein LguiA_033813 [Lonicera macranthoides]